MTSDRSGEDRAVLLLPPTARDGEVCRNLLLSANIECALCRDLRELCARLTHAAAIILPEEVVLSESADLLTYALGQQPLWSDLPVIVLSRAGIESPAVLKVMSTLRNVSLVERPLRVSTLLSVVQTALRSRERQYQLRDHLIEREKAESDLRDARAKLEVALSDAERAGRMKDDFLATLSHELRTPLNAILGWSQILRRGARDEADLAEGLETIERNARAQTQIIEDLLDMSRIISGKVRLDVQQIDLCGVIQAAIETCKPAAAAKGIALKWKADPASCLIPGDPNRLQQVFWNLISNSIKFTQSGGEVRIEIGRSENGVDVEVIDNGNGINPKFLPHVFDRFRQADPSTTRRQGGLGLGLSIVTQLVELHGGSVHAASDGDGRGSTFRVSLPVSVIHPEPKTTPLSSTPALLNLNDLHTRSCESIGGVRVLVVDDEADARSMIQRLLEDCDAIVTLAASAREALLVINREAPDVLVTDIGMPDQDGFELIRRVRALDAGKGGDIPAIALTAYARAEDRAKILSSGFQFHVAKPVDPSELITIIANLSSQKRRAVDV